MNASSRPFELGPWRWVLSAVLLIGLLCRLAAAMTMPLPLIGDAQDYHSFGEIFATRGALLDRDGQPLTYRPPGYPTFIAATYSVFGVEPRAVALVQAVLDTVVIALLYLFAAKRFGPKVGVVAAGLYALSPAAIFAAGSELTECVGTFEFALISALAVWLFEKPTLARAGVTGAAAAMLTLTRSVMALYPGFLALAALTVTSWPVRQRLLLAGAIVGGYVVGLSPWLVRNHGVMGRFALSTNSGDTLYSTWVIPPGHIWGNNVRDAVVAEAATMGKSAGDKFLVKKTIEYVTAHPGASLALLPTKLALTLLPWDWEVVGRGRHKAVNPMWPLLVLLCVAAWWKERALRSTPLSRVIIASFACFFVTSLMFYGSPRFRVPFELLLFIPAAVGALALLPKKERQTS